MSDYAFYTASFRGRNLNYIPAPWFIIFPRKDINTLLQSLPHNKRFWNWKNTLLSSNPHNYSHYLSNEKPETPIGPLDDERRLSLTD